MFLVFGILLYTYILVVEIMSPKCKYRDKSLAKWVERGRGKGVVD